MIKDTYLEQEISQFGGDKVFIVNSIYSEIKKIKEFADNTFISKTPVGFYVTTSEDIDDNTYPYQSLILHIAKEVGEGVIVANHGEPRILTKVKNRIPVLSSTVISQNEEIFESQLTRFMDTNEITSNNIVTITENDYSLKHVNFPFLLPKETQQLQISLLIKNKVLSFAVIAAVVLYCYSSIPSTIQKYNLEKEIAKLEQEKKLLEQKTQDYHKKAGVDIFAIKQESEQTEKLMKNLEEILKIEPLLTIKGKESKDKESLIMINFSANAINHLKKFNAEYNKDVTEIKIALEQEKPKTTTKKQPTKANQ